MSKRKRSVLAHPHRDCSKVCGAQGCQSDISSSRVYHVFNLEEDRRNFCKSTASIEDDSCLCPKCYNRMSNLWKAKTQGTEATPVEDAPSTSWDQPPKARKKERPPCYLNIFGLCNEVSVHDTACSDWAVFVANMGLHQFDTELQTEVPLCNSHYKKWNASERVTHCSVCQRLFSQTVKKLNIPDCDKILAHFKEIGDAKANLSRDSKVCIKCYKEFAKLKDHLDRVSFDDQISLDTDVQSMLDLYSGYLDQPANPENVPFHNAVVFCLRKLLLHTPFLLSEAYAEYRRAMDDYTKLSRVTTPSYFSSATLLGKLMQSLSKHMRQSTLQHEPSLGTLLWRAGDNTADLLLSQLNTTKKPRKQTHEPESSAKATDINYLEEAATMLKRDIHQVSEKFRDQTRKQDFASFDVSDIIEVIPARLWNFFAMITETKSQQSHRELAVDAGWLHDKHYVPEVVGDVGHRHKLRTFFGVCHAVYTHDDRCGYPIHTLLGEAVHGLGGSDELMRILNRFGITSSLSKIRDYEMDHVYIRLKYGWENVFTDNAFCFSSVDNVDKSSAHASVKAGGGARGIHATSYQIVEPKPRGLTYPTETDVPSTSSGSSGVQPSHTEIVLPTSVSVNVINEVRRKTRPQVISWDRSKKNVPYGSLKDFEIQTKEHEAILYATTQLLGYAIAKNGSSSSSDTERRLLFPDLNLLCSMPHPPAVEKSNVFYIGVLNEHADNINTIKEVVETLHEEIVVQRNLESLAVVGDGKTFFHLAKLKQEYSSELEWMIPFPGDWHTLKNLQPVLMKVYWHAGLSDLASTVHKGATLASVFQCSNFRRSHDFLILAWEALLRTQISSFMKYVDEHPELGLDQGLMVRVASKLDTVTSLDAESGPQVMLDTWKLVGGEFGHDKITADTALPDRSIHSWREAMLSDRDTKRKLVIFLATDLLIVAQELLKDGQRLITAGGFDGDMMDKANVATKYAIEEDSNFSSNHEESDSRVWLHCLNTPYSRVLIYSPDTDTYHIGLRSLYNPDGTMKKDAIVQLSMAIDSNEYVSLSKLVNFLRSDPDLDALPKDQLPTIMQTIYIASGCDYTSFFYGCGKASFLSSFFQHANFITGSDEEGTLANTEIQSEKGLFAFYRLVGSLYYKKFSSVMPSDFKTPKQLFQSFKTEDANLKIHHNWLDSIREHSWEKVDSEEEVMPSNEALSLHWQRTCWVAHLWGQAGNHRVNHAPITEYGYHFKNNELCVDWDTPNNIKKVEDFVNELTKGCKCRSGCGTRRCSCNKSHKNCRPGCSCCNCVNPHNDGKCTLCSDGEEIPNTGHRLIEDLSVEENAAMSSLQPDDTVYESEDGEDDTFPDQAGLTEDLRSDESDAESDNEH